MFGCGGGAMEGGGDVDGNGEGGGKGVGALADLDTIIASFWLKLQCVPTPSAPLSHEK